MNVYVALCYYKLDYYDVSQEVLAVYLQQYPDSATALNLKVLPPPMPSPHSRLSLNASHIHRHRTTQSTT